MKRIFSDLEVNTGRQYEFDLVKAITILLMIWTHVYEELSTGFEPSLSYMNAFWRGGLFGASAFMFCMGIGMVYTRSSSPLDYFKRGLNILLVGVVLNFFRVTLFALIAYATSGDITNICYLVVTLGVDILQFAGLAFMLMALLRKMGLRYRHILFVAMGLSILAGFLENVQTGNYAVDQALGFLWGTETESYFPLFYWFIFVAAGCSFGKIYRHLQDKETFHRIAISVGFVITAAYIYVGVAVDQNVFLLFKGELYLAHRPFLDAVVCVLSNVWLISLFYFIAKLIPEKAIPILTHPSKYINQYYCISWVVIMFLSFLHFSDENLLTNDTQTVIVWLVCLAVTIITFWVYQRWLKDALYAILTPHITFWVILIVVAVVACGVWGYIECDGLYPNLYNDYACGSASIGE